MQNPAISRSGAPPKWVDRPPFLSKHDIPAFILVCGFAWFFFAFTHPRPIGPDPHGYWFPAKIFVEQGHLYFSHPLNETLQRGGETPLVFPDGMKALRPGGQIYSTYPPGQTLAMAAFYRITGRESSMAFVTALFSIFLLLLTYFFAKQVSGIPVALVAVLLLGLQSNHPSFFSGVLSDPGATFFSLAGLFCFFSSRWALWLLGGFFMGMAVLFRAPNLLFFAGPVFVWIWKHRSLGPKPFWAMVLGAIPPALAVMGLNALAYGSPFATGYSNGLGGYSFPLFSLKNSFSTNELGHGQSLPRFFITLSQGLYILPLLLPWYLMLKKFPLAHVVLVGLPLLLCFALLSIYAFEAKGWDARFLLPFFAVLGPLSLAALWEVLPLSFWKYAIFLLMATFLLTTLPGHFKRLERHRLADGIEIEGRANIIQKQLGPKEIPIATDLHDVLLRSGVACLNLQHAASYERLSRDPQENLRLVTRMDKAARVLMNAGYTLRFIPGDSEADRVLFDHWLMAHRLAPAPVGYRVLDL